jgi:hypothetical protein
MSSPAVARLAFLAATLGASAAAAEPGDFHADAEVDPTAYVLSGFSIHVGLGYQRFRLDLGNFAMAIPQLVHGDDGFDVSFDGYGAKLQYFPMDEQRGLFVGVDAALVHMLAQRQGTDLAVRRLQLNAGVDVGYRIALPDDFYVTPWIGVGVQLGADDVTLAGATYHPDRVSVFPAIHIGRRFQ